MRQCPSYTDVIPSQWCLIVTVCAHEMNAGISHCSIHGSLCVDDGVGSETLDSLLGCSSFTLLCHQLLGWRSTQHHYTHMSMYTCTRVYREFLTIVLTTLGSLSNNVKFWVWSEIGWCYGNTSVAMSLTCDRSCRCRQTSAPHLLHHTEIYIYLKWVDW